MKWVVVVTVTIWTCFGEDTLETELLSGLKNLHNDLKQWETSLNLPTFTPLLAALHDLNSSLSLLNTTANRLKDDLNEHGNKANELYNLEDSLLRQFSNLSGQFAVLQSKIVHLDDMNVGDTVEAAFNKPSPRKMQIYLSVKVTQANNSKEFATVLEGLVQKEVTFRAIYGLLGMVETTQAWVVMIILWCQLNQVKERPQSED